MPMLPKIQLPLCDVRDLAEAYMKTLTLPNVAGMLQINTIFMRKKCIHVTLRVRSSATVEHYFVRKIHRIT